MAIDYGLLDQGPGAGSHQPPAIDVDRIVGHLVREVEILLYCRDRPSSASRACALA
jgi:hypothetical protein